MKRRDIIWLLAGAAMAWPSVVCAQQSSLPVIGFFRSTAPGPFANIVAAFRQGLKDVGYVEGKNVAIEYRWAENQLDRLPVLAADLIDRKVAVIVGNSLAVDAAKAITTTIPIVFVLADDPVKGGYVASLNRPGGNLTGVTFFGGGQLGAKRLELLRDLLPDGSVIAVLQDANYPAGEAELPTVEAAGRTLGREIMVATVAGESEFDAAFAKIKQGGAAALLVSGSPLFTSKRRQLIALAAQHGLPAIYDQRAYVESGGLMSYGASFVGAYRQAGSYAGRILNGEKPSELPVVQPTTFELAINLKTAVTLGLSVPPSIMLLADEVIE